MKRSGGLLELIVVVVAFKLAVYLAGAILMLKVIELIILKLRR